MQVMVIGVVHMHGVGKESKRSYDMSRLYCLAPMEAVSNETMTRNVSGYEVMEVDLKKESFPAFLDLPYPCKLDLQTDMVPRMGKLQTVIVGFKKP